MPQTRHVPVSFLTMIVTLIILIDKIPPSVQIPNEYLGHEQSRIATAAEQNMTAPIAVIIKLREICDVYGLAAKGCECLWGSCNENRPSPSCGCPWTRCIHYRPDHCKSEKNLTSPTQRPETHNDDFSCGRLGYAEPACVCKWTKCQSSRKTAQCACPWGRCMEDRPSYCQQSALPCVTSVPKFDVPKQECACAWGNCRTERPTSACACPWGDCTSPRDRQICHPKPEIDGGQDPRTDIDRDHMTQWVMYGLASFLIILILSIVGFCLYQTRRSQRLPILQYTIEDFTVPADARYSGDVSCDCLIDDKAASVYSTTGSLPSTSTEVDTDITQIDAVIDREDDNDYDDDEEDEDDDSLHKFGNLTPNQDLKIFEDSNYIRRKGSRD